MVVTSSIKRAIQHLHAIRDYLTEIKSPWQRIVAFSGEHQYGGVAVTEPTLSGFPSGVIPERVRTDPYRFLICADKFQRGYGEPLIHTMYVDKPLSGIKGVQNFSRLNRAIPKKHHTFVPDFQNDSDIIQLAFEDYYRTTILSEETDPNKLHDIKADLDGHQVYDDVAVDQLVERYLGGADRDQLDPIPEKYVANYVKDLDEYGPRDFRRRAKVLERT